MNAAQILKTPLYALQVATGAKSFAGNPILGSERLDRRGLHVKRCEMADRMAWNRRARMEHLVEADDRAAFARDGFVLERDFLAPDLYAAVCEEARAHTALCQEMRQGRAVTRRVTLDEADRSVLPHCRAAVADPRFDGVVRYVASHNARPLYYLQSIIADPDRGEEDPQTSLHLDTFHPIAKAWLFLQDVGEDDGPFQFVPGSHLFDARRRAWEYDQSLAASVAENRYHSRGSFRAGPEDLERMGLPQPRRMAVPGNTLVVADTHAFHGRTPSPKPTIRIELYATLRRNPFSLGIGPDPLAAPWVRDRPAALLHRAMEVSEKLGLRGNSWPLRGPKRMDSPEIG
jgi:hypothetical protein